MLDFFHIRVPEEHPPDLKILLALEIIMADLTALNAAVADNTAKVADVAALVAALKTDTDQAGIDAAATQIASNNATLAGLTPVSS